MFKHISRFFSETSFQRSDHPGHPFDFLSLVKYWPELVGDLLGQNTSPLRIRHKTLMVLTKHSLFTHELSFMERPILEKIFLRYPFLRKSIQKIQFQTSPRFFEQQDQAKELEKKESEGRVHHHRFSPEYKRLKILAEETFKYVDDPELKTLFISLYIQNALKPLNKNDQSQ